MKAGVLSCSRSSPRFSCRQPGSEYPCLCQRLSSSQHPMSPAILEAANFGEKENESCQRTSC